MEDVKAKNCRAKIRLHTSKVPLLNCRKGSDLPFHNLAEIVTAYKTASPGEQSYRDSLSDFLRWFEQRKSLSDAVDGAVLCNHPHQNCLSWAHRRQVANQLKACADKFDVQTRFDDIYTTVASCVRPPFKRADLFVYDISLRIGAYRKAYPSKVYLHCGALAGAKLVLGKKSLPSSIHPSLLLPEFSSLRPHEIEDCLCIYKPKIEELRQKGLLP